MTMPLVARIQSTMKVKFVKVDKEVKDDLLIVVRNICEIVSKHLSLPETITIELRKLGPSAYGETILDNRYKDRFKLNCDLSLTDIIIPTIHELIHLHQIHSGQLGMRRDGSYIWEGAIYRSIPPEKMSYRDYQNLPWELDVAKKQQKMLKIVLENKG